MLAALTAAGAGYEKIADRSGPPSPGRLVDIGGYRLHIDCAGQGGPTVVLDAGLGGTVLDWLPVRHGLSGRARVCAYDRAGMGWSDGGPYPRSPRQVASELHSLLREAQEPGPFVIVAHSLSGKAARLFTAAHPGDVAGLVMVDTRTEDIDAALPPAASVAFDRRLKRQAALLAVARRVGLVRLFGSALFGHPNLPAGVSQEMALLATEAKALAATRDEGLLRAADDAALLGALPEALPLVVVAAGESMGAIPGWAGAQRRLAGLSPAGSLVVAEGSSHAVHLDQPQVVVDAVISVLDAVAARR